MFGGCDEAADFVFQSPTYADAASWALLDQVFLNGVGDFDTVPGLTTGCGDGSLCFAHTPYEVYASGEVLCVGTYVAANYSVETNDTVFFDGFPGSNDLTSGSQNTWAVWTRHTPQTPQALLSELARFVLTLNIKAGVQNALDQKLLNALDALDRMQVHDNASAAGILHAFIQSVEAQRDKALTDDQANTLITDAQAIIDLLSQPWVRADLQMTKPRPEAGVSASGKRRLLTGKQPFGWQPARISGKCRLMAPLQSFVLD